MDVSPLDDDRRLTARNGSGLTLRRIADGDEATLAHFFAALSAATRNVFLPHGTDAETLRNCVRRDAAGRDRTYVLVAGPDIVGYGFLWEFDAPVPLLGIGLADAWQGQRLGDPMLRRLIDDARASGRMAVELTTVPNNVRAFRLYRRVGFEPLGEVENIAGDGRVVRELRMFLPLRPGAQPPVRQFGPPP